MSGRPARDRCFMKMALALGRRGLGRTSPNPPVGAVVVRRGQVVGAGYHRQAGAAHAEIVALRQAGKRARGADLYVTLEPCVHQGRTPPCAPAVVAAGIRRVVTGSRDPDPRVAGGGARYLRQAGLQVATGVCRTDCDDLIRAFRKRVRTGLPWVCLKLAATLDGRIATATGASRYLSGGPARRLVHELRNDLDALLVGAGTIIADDPALTCRRRGGRDPLRVILDGRLRVPVQARAVGPGAVVVTSPLASPRKLAAMERRGARVVVLGDGRGRVSMTKLLRWLARQGVNSVLLEGGGGVAAAGLRAGVVDRVVFFYVPRILGSEGIPMVRELGVRSLGRAVALRHLDAQLVGRDIVAAADVLPRGQTRGR